MRDPYYWDTGLVLILIGTPPWFTAPRTFAQHLKQRVSASRVAGGLALLRPRHA